MKNRLLFTTALIAAAFAVSDARAERLVVSSGEEEAVNAEMSANDNSELQGGAILNSGKLTVADGVVFNGNAGSVGGAVSTVDASGAAVIGDNVSFIGNTSAMQGALITISAQPAPSATMPNSITIRPSVTAAAPFIRIPTAGKLC